jgi:hypothetical protein
MHTIITQVFFCRIVWLYLPGYVLNVVPDLSAFYVVPLFYPLLLYFMKTPHSDYDTLVAINKTVLFNI